MAFEAIDFYCRILMTGSTEIFGVFSTHNLAICGGLCVTVDATGQAVFFRSIIVTCPLHDVQIDLA